MSRWNTIKDTKPVSRGLATGAQATAAAVVPTVQSPTASIWGSKTPYVYNVNGQPVSQNAKIPFVTKAEIAAASKQAKSTAAATKKQSIADAKAEYKQSLVAAKAAKDKSAIAQAKQDYAKAKAMAVAIYKDAARGANQTAAGQMTEAKIPQVVANQQRTNQQNQAIQGGASTSGQYGLSQDPNATSVQPLFSGLSDPLQSPAYYNPDRAKSYDQNLQDAIAAFTQQGKLPNPASDPGLYQAVNQFAIGQQAPAVDKPSIDMREIMDPGYANRPAKPLNLPTESSPTTTASPGQIAFPDINNMLSMLSQYLGPIMAGYGARAQGDQGIAPPPPSNPSGGSNNFMQALEMQRQRIMAQNASTPGFAAGGYLDQSNPPAPPYVAPSFTPAPQNSTPNFPQTGAPNMAPYTQYTHNPGVTSDITRGDDGQTGGVPVPGQTNPLW